MNDPLFKILGLLAIIGAAVKICYIMKPRAPAKSPLDKEEVMDNLDELIEFYKAQNPHRWKSPMEGGR